MAGRYRVTILRPTGTTKDVIINDCYSSDEAMSTAESMYGTEALSAVWIGNSDSGSSSRSSSSFSGGGDSLGAMIGFGALAVGGWILMMIIQYWWIFAIIIVILGGLLWLGRDELE
jgi:uncharacterized membrane protein